MGSTATARSGHHLAAPLGAIRDGAPPVKILVIIDDPPWGTERMYHGLRLAANLLSNQGESKLSDSLLEDGASGAKPGQQTPKGYYNIERALATVKGKGAQVRICGICMDARGRTVVDFVEGATRSTMDELGGLTIGFDRVLVR